MKLIRTLLLFCVSVSLQPTADATTAPSAIPAEELFRNFETSSAKFNPSGEFILSYVIKDDGYIIQLRDTVSFKPKSIVEFKNDQNAFYKGDAWIDSDTLLIDYKVDNDLKQALIEINYDGKKFHPKFHPIEQNGRVVSTLPDEQDRVLFSKSNSIRLELYTINTKDLLDGDFSNAATFDDHLDDADSYKVDSKGRVWFAKSSDNDAVYYWIFDRQTKDWIKVRTRRSFTETFQVLAVTNNHSMIVLTNEDSDKVVVQEYFYKDKKFGDILYEHERYDLTSAQINPKTKQVNRVSFMDHGRLTYKYFNVETEQRLNQVRELFPSKQALIRSTGNESEYIVHVYNTDDPGQYFFVNLNDNTKKKITNRRLDAIEHQYSPATAFAVKSIDGVEIEAFLTEPANQNGALLVMPHGGPINVQDTLRFDPEVQYLASRGYSILQVNFRGSDGRGKQFQKSGVGEFGKLIEQDIMAAYQHASRIRTYDHVCAIGASYGGYSSAMLAINHPDIFECVVARFGIYDLPLLFNTSNIQRRKENLDRVRNTVGEYSDSLKQTSPYFLAEKLNVPILITAGAKDTVADFEQSNRLKYRLQKLNKPVEFVYYPTAGHGHPTWNGDIHEMAQIDEFLERVLELKTTDDDRAVRAKQIYDLAQSYLENSIVLPNVDKSMAFAKRSSELGYPDAFHMLGMFYSQGLNVDKDLIKAHDYYHLGLSKGSPKAANSLGFYYQQHDHQDFNQAYTMFEKAESFDSSTASVNKAQLICLGLGVAQNISECLNILSTHIDDESATVASVIANLLSMPRLTSDDRNQITEFVKTNFDANINNDLDFELDEYGVFDADNLTRKKVFETRRTKYYLDLESHKDSTKQIDLAKESLYGIHFSIDGDYDSDSKDKPIPLRFVVKHPRMAKSSNLLDPNSSVYFGVYKREHIYSFLYPFDEDWQKLPGDWSIEVFSLSNELLFKQDFTVSQSESVVAP